jgi:hypothetical protein
MMVALLLYAYSQGVYSSRRIARGCEERLDFQTVTALNRPDFRTISEFRRRHLAALGELFVQVLALCQKACHGGRRTRGTVRNFVCGVKMGRKDALHAPPQTACYSGCPA